MAHLPRSISLVSSASAGSEIQALADHAAQIVPLGYMAQPDEIATSALFLASSDAKYVSGVELIGDGGLSQVGVCKAVTGR